MSLLCNNLALSMCGTLAHAYILCITLAHIHVYIHMYICISFSIFDMRPQIKAHAEVTFTFIKTYIYRHTYIHTCKQVLIYAKTRHIVSYALERHSRFYEACTYIPKHIHMHMRIRVVMARKVVGRQLMRLRLACWGVWNYLCNIVYMYACVSLLLLEQRQRFMDLVVSGANAVPCMRAALVVFSYSTLHRIKRVSKYIYTLVDL